MSLNQFFGYFGSKHRLSGRYPAALSEWCRSRRGQVMVCENEGARWLPFRPFRSIQSTSNGVSREVIWTNDLLG